MLTKILNKLSGKVTIDVTPEVFSFTRKNKFIYIKTFLYIYNDNGKNQILSIGKDFKGSDPCRRYELFTNDPVITPNAFLVRSELLEAFLRFGFRKIIGRSFTMPTTIFRGTQNLNEVLAGNQNVILKDAAFNAGAYDVEFVS